MAKEINTQPKQPGARTYAVEQMVRAVRKGAAQQIERMKIMAAMIEQQRRGQPPQAVNEKLTEDK